MARARTYRHDLRYPHCGSNWPPKDGHSRGKQTYRCRDCHHRFTPTGNRHYYPQSIKDQALDLYREGSSLAAIGRVRGILRRPSIPGSKKARQARKLMLREARPRKRQPKPARVIALDEMWTCAKARRKGKRRDVWVWTAVVEE